MPVKRWGLSFLWTIIVLVGLFIVLALVPVSNTSHEKDNTDEDIEYIEVDTFDTDSVVYLIEEPILIGKWKASYEGISYNVEIFQGEDGYYSIVDYGEGNTTHETLRKSGNMYYVSDSSVGDYYRIEDGDLTIGDDDGSIFARTTKLR